MKKYTDDELVEYLLNEGDDSSRASLTRALETDPELADRLASLETVCNQLRLLPMETFYTGRRSVSSLSLIIKAVILTGIFFTGALAQSEFSILNQHLNAPATIKPTSSGGDFPYSPRVIM